VRTLHTPTVLSFINIIIPYTNKIVKRLLGSCAAVARRVQPPAGSKNGGLGLLILPLAWVFTFVRVLYYYYIYINYVYLCLRYNLVLTNVNVA